MRRSIFLYLLVGWMLLAACSNHSDKVLVGRWTGEAIDSRQHVSQLAMNFKRTGTGKGTFTQEYVIDSDEKNPEGLSVKIKGMHVTMGGDWVVEDGKLYLAYNPEMLHVALTTNHLELHSTDPVAQQGYDKAPEVFVDFFKHIYENKMMQTITDMTGIPLPFKLNDDGRLSIVGPKEKYYLKRISYEE